MIIMICVLPGDSEVPRQYKPMEVCHCLLSDRDDWTYKLHSDSLRSLLELNPRTLDNMATSRNYANIFSFGM